MFTSTRVFVLKGFFARRISQLKSVRAWTRVQAAILPLDALFVHAHARVKPRLSGMDGCMREGRGARGSAPLPSVFCCLGRSCASRQLLLHCSIFRHPWRSHALAAFEHPAHHFFFSCCLKNSGPTGPPISFLTIRYGFVKTAPGYAAPSIAALIATCRALRKCDD